MKCDICPFCNKSVPYSGSGLLVANNICRDCNACSYFIKNEGSNEWHLYWVSLFTVINKVGFGVSIYNDRTIICNHKSNEQIVINKKLYITPSNIKDKLNLYLAIK